MQHLFLLIGGRGPHPKHFQHKSSLPTQTQQENALFFCVFSRPSRADRASWPHLTCKKGFKIEHDQAMQNAHESASTLPLASLKLLGWVLSHPGTPDPKIILPAQMDQLPSAIFHPAQALDRRCLQSPVVFHFVRQLWP